MNEERCPASSSSFCRRQKWPLTHFSNGSGSSSLLMDLNWLMAPLLMEDNCFISIMERRQTDEEIHHNVGIFSFSPLHSILPRNCLFSREKCGELIAGHFSLLGTIWCHLLAAWLPGRVLEGVSVWLKNSFLQAHKFSFHINLRIREWIIENYAIQHEFQMDFFTRPFRSFFHWNVHFSIRIAEHQPSFSLLTLSE